VVELKLDGGVARITLADPATGNALGVGMVHALEDAMKYAGRNPEVCAVVLDAHGPVFSAGAPRELLLQLSRGEVRPADILLPKVLLDCPVPIVAALAGHATGGGFALGLAADVLVLAAESRYGFTFMNMGFTPGMGTTALCEHFLPAAVAHELLYSGELRRGRDFAATGINHVVPAEHVLARALDVATRIAEKPRPAVEALKRALTLPRRQAFEASLTHESFMHGLTFGAAGASRQIEDEYVE
jgi:polyketide biosynthesis enoyl-CoA hydratase PksI